MGPLCLAPRRALFLRLAGAPHIGDVIIEILQTFYMAVF